MYIFWICITTFLASGLTLFSGFGLGTILMPVVAIFLPVPIAIAITAIVHLLNKVFKLAMLWRHVDIGVLVRFGIPALIAAIPGAFLLGSLSELPALAQYQFSGSTYYISPVKLVAGILLIVFATAEQWPVLKNRSLLKFGLPFGGALSGFFGGLTGHQGAFRSAFLVQGNLSERGFIATNAAVAAMVDFIRLCVYGLTFELATVEEHSTLIWAAMIASFLGVFIANEALKKVPMVFIQRLIGAMMYILGALLCFGLI